MMNRNTHDPVPASSSDVRLQSVLDGMDEAFGLLDHDFRILAQNKKAFELDGRSPAEIIGRTHWEVYPGTEASEIGLCLKRALDEQNPVTLEHRYTWWNGESRWLGMRAFPVPEGLAVFWRDITEQKATDQQLRETATKYHALFDSMDAAYAIVEVIKDETGRWSNFRFLEVNPAFMQHTGLPYPVGRTATELLGTPNPRWAATYGRVVETGEPVRIEEVELTVGRVFDVNIFRLGEEESCRVAVLFANITDRKLAEASLKASEEHYRLLFENIGEGFALARIIRDEAGQPIDWLYIDVNEAWQQTGLSRQETVGRTAREVNPLIEPGWIETYGKVVDTGEPLAYKAYAAGLEKWFETVAFRPSPDHFGLLVRDVTARVRTEEALRDSEARLATIFASASVGLSEIALDGRILQVNPELCRILGRTEAEVMPLSIADVTHPDDLPTSLRSFEAALQGKAGPGFDKRYLRPDGSMVWANSRIALLHHGHGQPDTILAVTMDITDRRATDDALRASEERYRAILERTTDYAIFTTDADGLIDTWPQGAKEVFGWSEDEALGQSSDITFTPEDRQANLPETERRLACKDGHASDIRWHLRKDGSRIFIEGMVRPLQSWDGHVTGFLMVGQNVTGRRETEAALLESETRFRQFGNASSDVLWIRDAATLGFEYVCPAFETVYGARIEDIANGDHVLSWAEMILPEDRKQAISNLRRVRKGEQLTHKFRILRPDGQIRWLRSTDFPLRDATGQVQRIGGIAHDATEELEWQERLKILVAELQHRSRNLISVVQAVSERTLATSDTLQQFQARFRARLSALGRVNGLLSRLDDGERITFDQLLQTELRAHGVAQTEEFGRRISLNGPSGVPLPSATVQTFALAIHELTTNALKHGALSKPEGRLSVSWSIMNRPHAAARLRVDWVETGVQVDHPDSDADTSDNYSKRHGYGRELIERALPYQLNAETFYALTPGGVTCAIIVPISTTMGLAFSSG